MWRKELIKNKIFGIMLIVIGALTLPIEGDATVFLSMLPIGLVLFFSKKDCITY